jgi:hypothetical protein
VIAFQPGLVPDQRTGCGGPPAAIVVALALVSKKGNRERENTTRTAPATHQPSQRAARRSRPCKRPRTPRPAPPRHHQGVGQAAPRCAFSRQCISRLTSPLRLNPETRRPTINHAQAGETAPQKHVPPDMSRRRSPPLQHQQVIDFPEMTPRLQRESLERVTALHPHEPWDDR